MDPEQNYPVKMDFLCELQQSFQVQVFQKQPSWAICEFSTAVITN